MNDTVVVDCGSSSIKVGYSGDDIPFSIVPSVDGKFGVGVDCIEASSSSSSNEFSNMNLSSAKSMHPMKRGIVTNWEQMEKLYGNVLKDVGNEKHMPSILVVESMRTTLQDRLKYAEMLFDTFHAPSIAFANAATMALFASGRTTGLVAECGAGSTSVVPIFEGLVISYGSTTIDFGGQDITASMQNTLADKGYKLDLNDVRLMKQSLARIKTYEEAHNNTGTKGDDSNDEDIKYELPDGQEITYKKSMLTEAPEQLLFNKNFTPNGLVNQIYDSLKLCDDTLRCDLANNIVISGGTSMLTGFGDRLQDELTNKITENKASSLDINTCNVIPSKAFSESGYTTQRKYASWIGASIFASLSKFQSLRIKRTEWEENAERVIQCKSW